MDRSPVTGGPVAVRRGPDWQRPAAPDAGPEAAVQRLVRW
jgi:hypothetical protein